MPTEKEILNFLEENTIDFESLDDKNTYWMGVQCPGMGPNDDALIVVRFLAGVMLFDGLVAQLEDLAENDITAIAREATFGVASWHGWVTLRHMTDTWNDLGFVQLENTLAWLARATHNTAKSFDV